MSQGVVLASHGLVLALLVILKQNITVLSQDDYGGGELNVAYRPMPSDLVMEMQNKTTYEMEMEECMTAFVICKRGTGNRKLAICGEAGLQDRKSFESLCDMTYAACKGNGYRYLHDGKCKQ